MQVGNGLNKTISAVRGMAIIFVVVGHAIIPAIREESRLLQYFWNSIYSFHMFLFFFISGYLFQKGIEKYLRNKKVFIVNKFKLLIIPYATLTIMEYGLLLIDRFDRGENLLQALGLPSWSFFDFAIALCLNNGHYDTHLWFIYTLFFVFAINIAIPEISGELRYFVFLVLCSGLYPVLGKFIVPVRSICYWSVPFWVGRKYFKNNLLTKSMDYKGRQIGILCALFVAFNVGLNILDELSGKLPIALAYIRLGAMYEIKHLTGIIGVIILFWTVNHIKGKTLESLFKLDKYSYDIYILHQPFLTVGVATLFLRNGINPGVTVILTTVCVILVSIILSKYFIRKTRFLNIALLGNRNKVNNIMEAQKLIF